MPVNKGRILKVGVTGGIGSGKSTVCDIFSKIGLTVIRSDEISRNLSDANPVIREKMVSLLGNDTYTRDGILNRSFVASRIFAKHMLRRKVESIIHPFVEKERGRIIKELLDKGEKVVIIESALIFEVGLDKKLDLTILVYADEKKRIERVSMRDSVSESDIKMRMNAQTAPRRNFDKADYVIFNNSSAEELESKVRFLYNILVQQI